MVLTELTGLIVDAGLKVHRTLGPGLLESAYEFCLAREFELRGVLCERQVPLPIVYEGGRLEGAYRLDMLIDGQVIVEIKAVPALTTLHTAQLATYLKLSGYKVGLLLNFDVPLFKDGVRRLNA